MNNIDSIHKKELAILTLAFLMPILIAGVILFNNEEEKLEIANELQPVVTSKYQIDPQIRASSAMVTELKTGKVLFSKNENVQKPIASLTKLMTTLVAEENFSKNNVSRVQINENHLKAFGDSGLQVGQIWNVKDLIDFTLITSSNDGAKALALSAFGQRTSEFVSEMNSLASKLGLANTFFANETGLDINLDTEAGAISTAEDITKILRFITLHKADVFFGSTQQQKTIITEGETYQIENTNKSVSKLPGVLVSKTGYTDLAGGNLAIVADFGLNNPVSIVVLGSTTENREADVEELFREARAYYSANLRE